MKIVMFTDAYAQTAGICKHIHDLAETLTAKKHKVVIYTGSGHSNKYKVVNLPHVKSPLSPEYEIIFTNSLMSKVKADKI